jgi:hypothetical protein
LQLKQEKKVPDKKKTKQTIDQRTRNKGKERTVSSKGAASALDFPDLPLAYDDTQVTLVARSPFSLYAYWDVSQSSLSQLKKQWGAFFNNAKYYLRVYEVTPVSELASPGRHSFDLDIDLSSRKQYIDLPKDNADFCADIGYTDPQGDFQVLASSNVVSAQRQAQSPSEDLQWMSVQEDGPREIATYTDQKYQQYNDDLSPLQDQKTFSLYGGRIPLTAEQIWAYYSRLTPLLKKVHLQEVQLSSPAAEDISGMVSDPLKKYQPKGAVPFVKDSISYNEHVHAVHSSADFMEESRSSDFSQSMPSSHHAGLDQMDDHKDFFFELNTELIVYGRTEPNATVTHGNQKVNLNPDGTFSMRFSLPDAHHIPLDFTAQSFDRTQQRSIRTAVERFKTMYVPG